MECWGWVISKRTERHPLNFHAPKMIETCVLSTSYVVVMPKKRQALVEFEDVLGACNAVNYAADNQIYTAGHPAFVSYSTSQKISRPGDSDDSRSVNSVLLFTILNPIYSITTVRVSRHSCRLLYEVSSLLHLPITSPCQTDFPGLLHLACLCFYRMFFTLSVILVALSRELSFSGRTEFRLWWNILFWETGVCFSEFSIENVKDQAMRLIETADQGMF